MPPDEAIGPVAVTDVTVPGWAPAEIPSNFDANVLVMYPFTIEVAAGMLKTPEPFTERGRVAV